MHFKYGYVNIYIKKKVQKKFNQQTTEVMKIEESRYKQGKFLSNKFKPRGLRVDPARGSAQGTKGGPGEGERPGD